MRIGATRPGSRGMALVQALVLVAALAAVAAALLLRAETARERLQVRFQADQAALYLDSGTAQLQVLLGDARMATLTHRGQQWAEERDDVRVADALVSWQIDDLQGRFNVNTLNGTEDMHRAARAAFVRLAHGQGLSRAATGRMADALGADAALRASAVTGVPLVLPLVHPVQLAPLAGPEVEAFARLLPLLSALSVPTAININTVHDEVLLALVPSLTAATVQQMQRRLRRAPVENIDGFSDWALDLIGDDALAALLRIGITTSSRSFQARLAVQLDSLRLRRSVVLTRDGAQGRSRVTLTLPEPE